MDAWANTRLWEQGDDAVKALIIADANLEEGEAPILYTFVNAANWTLFTTRAVVYAHNGKRARFGISSIDRISPGNFKGHGGQAHELFEIVTGDGVVHLCPYETGKQSMGTFYALQTLRRVGPHEQPGT